MSYQPLMVSIKLSTPVIVQEDSWLTLDSLLAAAIFRRTNDLRAAHSTIPLARTGVVWHGSAMFLIDPTPSSARFIADMNPVRGSIPEGTIAPKRIMRVGGDNKPQVDLYRAFEAGYAVWFGNGEIAEVRSLLSELNGIGKKVSHGYGVIEAIEVTPMKTDRSYQLPDGTPARPISVSLWDKISDASSCAQDMVAFEPPYWQVKEKGMLSVVPDRNKLSMAHLEYIDSGDTPKSLPKIVPPADSPSWQSGMDFFYLNHGMRLFETAGIPGDPKGAAHSCNVCGATQGLARAGKGYTTLCARCFTFAGQYEGIKRPGRMGAGWMGLITADKARLVTSVEYSDGDLPFEGAIGVELLTGKEALLSFLHAALTAPPEPPYLFFMSSNSSVRVAQNLTVTWSNRRAWICDNDKTPCDLLLLNEALHKWRQSEFVIADVVKAARIRQDMLFTLDASRRERAEQAWGAYQGTELGDLVEQIPLPHTTEFGYFARLGRWEEQNA